MNKTQFNSIERFNAVILYLEEYRAIWEGFTIISDTVAELQGRTRLILDKVQRQTAPISRAIDERDLARLHFERALIQTVTHLAIHADRTGDLELGSLCEFTLSTLHSMHHDALEAIGVRIHRLVIEHLDALADYNLTAEEAEVLQDLLGKYRQAKHAPRLAMIERMGQTATLPTSIRGASQLLRRRLDKLMLRFVDSHPEFLAGYQSARGILRRGATAMATPPPGPATATNTERPK